MMARRISQKLLPVLVALLAACAMPGAAPPPAGPIGGGPVGGIDIGEVRWTVVTRPQMDLWYHGLALTRFGLGAGLSIYRPGYVEEITAAKRAAGVYPTALDRRAEEFGRLFASNQRYTSLQFLPLYFPNAETFFTAMRAWIQASGDPRRVQDQSLAQAVAFISQQLPTEEARRTVSQWLEALAEEDRVFYSSYRRNQEAQLLAIAGSAQVEWDRLAPALEPVLDYLILNRGELMISHPLGPEGRTLELGRSNNRVAVGSASQERPDEVVWAFIHELLYPFVATVITDVLSPAQRREVDEQVLAQRAAVRAGAILLDRVAPEAAPRYRAAYLRWAGVAVPAAASERERALEQAYPVPAGLPQAMADALATILRGI